MATDVRIVETLAALPAELDRLASGRVLVLTTPGRRFLDRLDLGGRPLEVFDGARVHVPKGVVEEAEQALARSGADTLVTIGGGSATGLAKALRLRRDVRFVAIPTTFSGSEMTRIWGVTDDGDKVTGRDDRVRPDVVVHDPALLGTLPRRIAVASLLNALAAPISAWSAGPLDEALERQGAEALRVLGGALDLLLQGQRGAHAEALRGVRLGASVLDRAPMGPHHKVVHRLGGAFDLEHGATHAVLLPHSARELLRLRPERAEALVAAIGVDPPARLYDALVRSGNARSLVALGVDPVRFAALAEGHPELRAGWVDDALVGRRPSLRERRWTVEGQPDVAVYGPALADAARVVVALHGRGADAGSIARTVLDLVGHDPRVAVVAPQAPGGAWYPLGYRRSLAEHGEALARALAQVDAVLDRVAREAPPERTLLFGFSQGACLAAEVFARAERPLAGLVALAGARIGLPGEHPPVRRDLAGRPVLLGASAADRWLEAADVEATAAAFRAAGAEVDCAIVPGDAHAVTGLQRVLARRILAPGPLPAPSGGFGNTLESEALPGALPRRQNNPRRAPFGLYAEQLSGTGFTAPRRDNRRLWLYRVRPSAQHLPFEPLPHPTLVADWTPPEPNLCAWRPLPLPGGPADWVDGLVTLGGAGDPRLRRGYAVHLYAANRSMDDRAFCSADGDLLIVPWQGRLVLLTEVGVLELGPGRIGTVPRGMRFSVLLPDGTARGYVGESYGRRFELPERGPLGANGLADARHFRAPPAWFEDRLAPGYRLAFKLGGALFEATQDHSPYDVVAWHGDHLPYVYDLLDFSPAGNTRFDHADPSVHTVLHTALDEAGTASLDLVVFPPRWDPSEDTFRPPYFHRNATTEINGVIADPSLDGTGPFQVGGTFVTPAMTAHGILARGVERALDADPATADRPSRVPDGSWWFQFETTLPFHPTAWARGAQVPDWPRAWGVYRPRFSPP